MIIIVTVIIQLSSFTCWLNSPRTIYRNSTNYVLL